MLLTLVKGQFKLRVLSDDLLNDLSAERPIELHSHSLTLRTGFLQLLVLLTHLGAIVSLPILVGRRAFRS